MGIFDWKHWLVILLVIALVFGTRRLRHIGSDLGGAIKGFRQSMDQHDVPPVEPRVADQSAEGARGRA